MKNSQPTAALHPGHLKAVERLEDTDAYQQTLTRYQQAINAPVYLRPTGAGFTVLSLDPGTASMIGVGARGTSQHTITTLPPSEKKVRRAATGYFEKRATLRRPSEEEIYSVALIRQAFAEGLAIGQSGAFFINQEWKLPSGRRMDLLGVNPSTRRLIVIELKADEASALVSDAGKGGDAWEQVESYASELHEHRQVLYPFFQRLARAMAKGHGASKALAEINLDPDAIAETMVSWPMPGSVEFNSFPMP